MSENACSAPPWSTFPKIFRNRTSSTSIGLDKGFCRTGRNLGIIRHKWRPLSLSTHNFHDSEKNEAKVSLRNILTRSLLRSPEITSVQWRLWAVNCSQTRRHEHIWLYLTLRWACQGGTKMAGVVKSLPRVGDIFFKCSSGRSDMLPQKLIILKRLTFNDLLGLKRRVKEEFHFYFFRGHSQKLFLRWKF